MDQKTNAKKDDGVAGIDMPIIFSMQPDNTNNQNLADAPDLSCCDHVTNFFSSIGDWFNNLSCDVCICDCNDFDCGNCGDCDCDCD